MTMIASLCQMYGSNQIELSWTVIPILIVLVLFLATTRVIIATEKAHAPAEAMNVTVIGHQFWWEYRYPGTDVVTANELHVPIVDADNKRPTYLTMTSADTDHSFWVPRLAGKLDVIPNKVNVMWFDPRVPDLYLGQCAQYCGTQHAKMLIRVYAQKPADFDLWLHNQELPAVEDAAVQDGRAVFEQNSCMNCHRIRGTVADGRFGPDLTHFASRDTLASGSVESTPANVGAVDQGTGALQAGRPDAGHAPGRLPDCTSNRLPGNAALKGRGDCMANDRTTTRPSKHTKTTRLTQYAAISSSSTCMGG